ncbi:protein containing calx-beta domain [Hahella chejuensis KCTC 2396]|uniref:Protein containing calx-beta domain n=1 Tax=Hahella chejuensis (strain KCTC 2396) TaxID=349521 RepID=Q2SGU7_HAHCH|nr:Calx-beta domain-containing protein [Hahella chejuensis]ABC30127.1 protein containing calx-beta domain [Hahella chejuensis KCTC 2396]
MTSFHKRLIIISFITLLMSACGESTSTPPSPSIAVAQETTTPASFSQVELIGSATASGAPITHINWAQVHPETGKATIELVFENGEWRPVAGSLTEISRALQDVRSSELSIKIRAPEVAREERVYYRFSATDASGNSASKIVTLDIQPLKNSVTIAALNSRYDELDEKAEFQIILASPSKHSVNVGYETVEGDETGSPSDVDGPADADRGDFEYTRSQVIFAAGETSKIISIAITDDNVAETDEVFSVKLTDASSSGYENVQVGAPGSAAVVIAKNFSLPGYVRFFHDFQDIPLASQSDEALQLWDKGGSNMSAGFHYGSLTAPTETGNAFWKVRANGDAALIEFPYPARLIKFAMRSLTQDAQARIVLVDSDAAELSRSLDVPSASWREFEYLAPEGRLIQKVRLDSTGEDLALDNIEFYAKVPEGAIPKPSGRVYIQGKGVEGRESVVMEAEDYTWSLPSPHGNSWTRVHEGVTHHAAGASGGFAMRAPMQYEGSDEDYSSRARLDYIVDFLDAGVYYVWVRGVGFSGEKNAVNVGLDGVGARDDSGFNLTFASRGVWSWGSDPTPPPEPVPGQVKRSVTVAAPGLHTLNLWVRDAEIIVDKILLVKSNDGDDYEPPSYEPDYAGPAAVRTFSQSADGRVIIQAEQIGGVTSGNGQSWRLVADAGADEGYAMQATQLEGETVDQGSRNARMDYQINFTGVGDHYVWMKGYSEEGDTDTLYVGLNGKVVAEMRFPHYQWNWTRKQDKPIKIPATGVHTLNLWMKEAGLKVDKILLTSDRDEAPTD